MATKMPILLSPPPSPRLFQGPFRRYGLTHFRVLMVAVATCLLLIVARTSYRLPESGLLFLDIDNSQEHTQGSSIDYKINESGNETQVRSQ